MVYDIFQTVMEVIMNGHFWDYQEGYQNGLDYSDHYLDHLVFQGLRLIYDDFHHCLKNIIYHR
jgi:hypothetical protein